MGTPLWSVRVPSGATFTLSLAPPPPATSKPPLPVCLTSKLPPELCTTLSPLPLTCTSTLGPPLLCCTLKVSGATGVAGVPSGLGAGGSGLLVMVTLPAFTVVSPPPPSGVCGLVVCDTVGPPPGAWTVIWPFPSPVTGVTFTAGSPGPGT